MRDSWDVYVKSGAVCMGVCLANLELELTLTPFISDRALRWASAFAVIQGAAIILLVVYLLGRRALAGLKDSIYEQLRPAIHERVSALALAGEKWSSVVPEHGAARHVLEESIANSLSTLKESGRDRIAQFAVDHGFSAQWIKALSSPLKRERKRAVMLLGLVSQAAGSSAIPAALGDNEPAVRIEAARALLMVGDLHHVDRVFRSMLRESLLVRALLASDLKLHARYLLANTIPEVLAEGSHVDIVRCLETMVAWKRALPSFDIRPWLAEPRDPLIWRLALAMLPYVPVDDSIGDHLLRALESTDLEVQCAAARAAGQLRIERLMPALALSLSQNRQLALSSATAMAQMGMPGERDLAKMVCRADREAAAVAMEALESLTVGVQ